MTTTQSILVEGSIQWAMNRGTLFQVDGIYKYGHLATCSDTPLQAAQSVLYRGSEYCVWIPNETVLTVWNVYGGSIGGFCMKDAQRFVVRNGEVFPVIPPAKFAIGDLVALGQEFPEFQRGWKARIVSVYDHVSDFGGSRMYEVRFVRDGGWLAVSESNLVAAEEQYTVMETGSRIVASKGEWNSPKDGNEARPQYWLTLIPGEYPGFNPGLRAGEWDLFNVSQLPEGLADRLNRVYLSADRKARPWAF